jgi:hypothetical protein
MLIFIILSGLVLPVVFAVKGMGTRGYYVGIALLSIVLGLLFGMVSVSMQANIEQRDGAWLAHDISSVSYAVFVGGILGVCFFTQKKVT